MKFAWALALTLFVASRANAEGLVVAVFDVEAPTLKLKAATIDGLSEYVATQLATAGTMHVVPRTDLQERLKAQKAASLEACYQESCQIEIGKELAAGAALSTKVLRIDKRCVAAMKLFDLRSATTIAAATRDGDCSESALIQLLGATAGSLVENAKSWQLRAAWEELEPVLPTAEAADRRSRLDAFLVRYPGHKPAIDARDVVLRELESTARAEAARNRALGKVQVAGGRWCFPGQAYGSDKCVGVPTSCPVDFAIDAAHETCAPPVCTAGRGRAPDGVHCCWQDQVWSSERRICVGNPTCPPGQFAFRERCGDRTAPLLSEVRRLLDNHDYRVTSDRDVCSPIVYRYKITDFQPCRVKVSFQFINEAGDSSVNCQDYAPDEGAQYSFDLQRLLKIWVLDRRSVSRAYHAEEALLSLEGDGSALNYVAPYADVRALAETLKRLAFVCGSEQVDVETTKADR